jgi:putative ABC transport system ATP-binding protein
MAIFMQSGVGMILLALYHPYLLVFDVLLLAAILWVLFGLGRGAVATSVKESKLKYAVAAWLEEIARHMVTFKSGAGTTLATKHADSLVQEYLHARKKHFRIVLRQAGGSLGLQAVASAVLLGIGGWLVMDGELTLGQLVAAELIVTAVVGGFAKFGKHLEVFYDLAAAMDKLGQVIDLPLERSGGASLPVEGKPARVEFHKLSFGYSNKKPILNEVSWTLESGVRAAVMGPSGMGKSATADLLYGLRSPVTGTIFLDGVDYRDLSLQSLRSHVALVRSAEVFSGTIAENISLGRAGIGHREIREALRMVGLLDEVSTLPAGIDTHLSTGGLPLSPGQTARLMIARALAGQPRLLILDETLDQIDDVREREVLYQYLFHQDAPWTLLVITHSPEVLQHCQEIYGLADGKLTEIPPFRKPERSE